MNQQKFRNKKSIVLIAGILCSCFLSGSALTYSDSTKTDKGKKYKAPKHYFKNTLFINTYGTAENNFLNKKGKRVYKSDSTYNFGQSISGFYFPVFTRDYYKDDSTRIANLHILLTGVLLSATPSFSFIERQHTIYKGGLGCRLFYNTGKKNVWFWDLSPFYTQDNQSISSFSARYSSMVMFNRTVSDKFSYRLGLTKTFVFGNRFYFPVIGFRAGSLDGVYFSFLFPRNMSINFPLGKKVEASLYIKPHGGIYNFTNSDSIYNGSDSIIQFGRYEFLSGLKLDFRISERFSFFIGAGIAQNRQVTFYSFSYNQKNIGSYVQFFNKKVVPSGYLNLGLSFRFGKAKKVYNNMNMYDVFDLNNTYDMGDANETPAGKEIPKKGSLKNKKLQYKDIEDLIQLEDIFN